MSGDPSNLINELFSAQDERQLVQAVVIPRQGALTPQQRTKVTANARKYLKKHGITQGNLARAIGEGQVSTWSAILNDKHPSATLDKYLRSLNAWIEEDARRRLATSQAPYVLTSVAKTIGNAAKLAKQNRAMILVFGPAGVGKSCCAEVACEQSPGSIYIRLGTKLRTAGQISDELVYRLGINRPKRGCERIPVREHQRAMFDRLGKTGRLLAIDEADLISDTGLEFVREVYDRTKCPVLLLSTMLLWDRIRLATSEDRGQLRSRIEQVVDLAYDTKRTEGSRHPQRMFSREDIRDLFNSPAVRLTDEAVDYLWDVANDLGQGSLRTCGPLVRDAASVLRNRKQLGRGAPVTLNRAILHERETRSAREHGAADHVEQRWQRCTRAAAG